MIDAKRLADLHRNVELDQMEPNEGWLDVQDYADLLALLDEKAEQLKAGGIGTEGDNGVSPRTRLGSTPSADAPGPTDEERREMVEWLDEMVKSFEIIGTHPRHIETPKAIRRLILSSPAKSPEGASVSREWFLRRAHDIIRGRDSGAEAAFEFALNDLGITVEDSEEEKGRNP